MGDLTLDRPSTQASRHHTRSVTACCQCFCQSTSAGYSGWTELTVMNAPKPLRVGICERRWQKVCGEILVANRPQEPLNGTAADGGSTGIRCGRERPTMHHGVSHFNAGRKTIDQQTPGLAL